MYHYIYYCPVDDRCFSVPSTYDISEFYDTGSGGPNPEFLATYDSEEDSLEYRDLYFNYYELRDDWDEEVYRVIQKIIDSPVIWYCLIHGDCHITDRYVTPKNPCGTQKQCICELIATVNDDRVMSTVGDLKKYFDNANDGYTVSHLESELALHQLEGLTI